MQIGEFSRWDLDKNIILLSALRSRCFVGAARLCPLWVDSPQGG
jgi:hypothetical protein